MKPRLQPTSIDQIVRREVQQDPLLEEAITLYEKEKENITKIRDWWERQRYTFNLKTPALSPAQIALFCEHEEPHEAFPHYLNYLIQKSYNNGHNNLILAFNIPHTNLLSQVQGTREQPLIITINGNTKDYCAYESKHLNLTINGNTKDYCAWDCEHLNLTINGNTKKSCAAESKRLNLTINGNTEDWCAWNSEHLNLTINGNTKDYCAWNSGNAKITINGTIGDNPDKNTTYFTNNKETYEHLKNNNCKVTRL